MGSHINLERRVSRMLQPFLIVIVSLLFLPDNGKCMSQFSMTTCNHESDCLWWKFCSKKQLDIGHCVCGKKYGRSKRRKECYWNYQWNATSFGEIQCTNNAHCYDYKLGKNPCGEVPCECDVPKRKCIYCKECIEARKRWKVMYGKGGKGEIYKMALSEN